VDGARRRPTQLPGGWEIRHGNFLSRRASSPEQGFHGIFEIMHELDESSVGGKKGALLEFCLGNAIFHSRLPG